jgi:hypothetical protein
VRATCSPPIPRSVAAICPGCEGSGLSRVAVKLAGAAQRRAKNRYGREVGPWDRHWDTTDDRVRRTMPADVAAIILDEAKR